MTPALMAQKYPKPPIVEAVLQMRFGTPLSDGELKRVPHLLASEYPKSKDENEFQLKFRIEKGAPVGTPQPERRDHGSRMLSANDQRMVVIRQGYILYVFQAPYQGWDEFVDGARFVFDTVRDKIGYKEVTRLGLRYINRIDIPLKDDELYYPQDYLTIGAWRPPDGVTENMRLFSAVVESDLSHDKLIARVGTGTAEEAIISHGSLLFDIDIISQVDVPKKPDDIWALLGRMRDAKNAIFESGVTDKARQLFGWKQ